MKKLSIIILVSISPLLGISFFQAALEPEDRKQMEAEIAQVKEKYKKGLRPCQPRISTKKPAYNSAKEKTTCLLANRWARSIEYGMKAGTMSRAPKLRQ